MYCLIQIADYTICFLFHDDETVKYFHDEILLSENPVGEIHIIPEVFIRRHMKMSQCSFAYAEYMSALYIASTALLKHGICCFHSVAVRVKNKGYLIYAPSGTGKTTQYLNLKKLYGDEIEIINGDKPFLHFKEDNTITIYPSLWRGKEDYGNDISCELAGLICLVQTGKNKLFRMYPEELVMATLKQFLYHADSEDTVRKVCELDRRLLNAVPLWQLENIGDLSSSKLLYERVLSAGGNI